MTDNTLSVVGEEQRSLENPQVPISSASIVEFLGIHGISAAGVNVTIESALGIPAIWCAVSFLSSTVAGLPAHTYRKGRDQRKKINNRVSKLLHDNINEEMSSFAWRKQVFERVLTTGRSYTLIVRGKSEPIRYLWPLENSAVTVKRSTSGNKEYHVKQGKKTKIYPARDVIDMSFMLKENGVDHYSPILNNKDTIGLGIAATKYGSRFFQNGGVPPFALIGNFQSSSSMNRAAADLQKAVKEAAKEDRLALPLPKDHDLKTLGVDPEKSQLVELKKFQIEEYARIYNLPPTFLQDLTHGTYSNTEQQDLHFVKHTLMGWVNQFEAELNLKLFGWDKNDKFVEFNVEGIQRGDFKTRMEGYALGIQNAITTPNEVRRRENMPDMPEGDGLLVQGATVPLGSQPTGESDDT